MLGNAILRMLSVTCVGALLAACSGDQGTSPTGILGDGSAPRTNHTMAANAALLAAELEPFTVRASLDPYKIHQLPNFMMHSKAATDIVIQRSVFQPGAGPWHTHPGPSFVYVIEGEIKVDRVTGKGKCSSSPVHGPGEAYFEVANEVHRAVVVSAEPAVLLVTRFNIPIGQSITSPADDPGC